MATLTKDQSRKRWAELRQLWNEWDPIGVSPSSGGPQDEYDAYVGVTMRMLERRSSDAELVEYLSWLVGEHMGMGQVGITHSDPRAFAARLRLWFSSAWEGTHV